MGLSTIHAGLAFFDPFDQELKFLVASALIDQAAGIVFLSVVRVVLATVSVLAILAVARRSSAPPVEKGNLLRFTALKANLGRQHPKP